MLVPTPGRQVRRRDTWYALQSVTIHQASIPSAMNAAGMSTSRSASAAKTTPPGGPCVSAYLVVRPDTGEVLRDAQLPCFFIGT